MNTKVNIPSFEVITKEVMGEVKKIKLKDFFQSWWLGDDTFSCNFKVSKELQKLMDSDTDYLLAEYWIDEESFRYFSYFVDGDERFISEYIPYNLSCDYLNNLVRRHLEAENEK